VNACAAVGVNVAPAARQSEAPRPEVLRIAVKSVAAASACVASGSRAPRSVGRSGRTSCAS